MLEIILIIVLLILSGVVFLLAVTNRKLQQDVHLSLEEIEDVREAFDERRKRDNEMMNNERFEAAEIVAQLRRELQDSYSSLELALEDNSSPKKGKR